MSLKKSLKNITHEEITEKIGFFLKGNDIRKIDEDGADLDVKDYPVIKGLMFCVQELENNGADKETIAFFMTSAVFMKLLARIADDREDAEKKKEKND